LVKANPASSSSTDALAPAEGDDTAPAIDETPRPSSLHEESRSLVEARSALRRGDTAGAQRKLNEMGERFPDGVLAQEREALAIEALHRSGRRAAASARASAFLRAHPTSPHATKIRSFLK
jgi:outer membrane protein assembly factor BamD (BamD/ComL family)